MTQVAPESTGRWTSTVETAMAMAERTEGHAALLYSSVEEEGNDVWHTRGSSLAHEASWP
jgi:adenine-specific DNA methylase